VLAAHRHTLPPPGPPSVLVELTDDAALARLLDSARPEAVVHAAAIGQANRCQERPEEAHHVNAVLPGTLGRLCRERGLRLVALSTDLVFGGDRAFLREDDPPAPLGVYGRTKLAGEDAALAPAPPAAVARVALTLGRGHGARGTSTESSPGRSARGGPVPALHGRVPHARRPRVAGRRAGAPSRARRLGVAFHLGGPERISRHELGLRVARALGLPESRITAGLQSDTAGPDRAPPTCRSTPRAARRELGWTPRPIDEAIREGRPEPGG